MVLDNPQFQWRSTNATHAVRHDDIWFFDADKGWTVNSDGKVRKTDDGPWPEEWIALFERWIAEGHPA